MPHDTLSAIHDHSEEQAEPSLFDAIAHFSAIEVSRQLRELSLWQILKLWLNLRKPERDDD